MKLSIALITFLIVTSAHAADDLSQFSQLFIYREARFVGSGLEPTIHYDGTPLVTIPSGRFHGGLIPAGTHTIELEDLKTGAKIDAKPGESFYIRVEIVPGVFVGGVRLTMIQPEQGRYDVEKLVTVTSEQIRNPAVRLVNDPSYPMRVTMDRMRIVAEQLVSRRRPPERLPRSVPALDAWGTPFRYIVSADGTFTVVSAGEDRQFDEESWTGPRGLSAFSADDCVIRGEGKRAFFLRAWEISDTR